MAFVAVEGIDGAGKSTAISRLAQLLPRVYVTAEPSRGPIGRLIKEWALRGGSVDPHVDALLFAADRIEHYRREVEPRLREGYIVVTERYIESSLAYQVAAGVAPDFVACINSAVPRPHLTVILDLPPEVAVARLAARTHSEKFERLEFLRRVREIYLARARERGYPVLDATEPPEEVAKRLAALIEDLVGVPGGRRG